MPLLSTNFHSSEFACSCCGEEHMDTKLIAALQRARDIAYIPFVINSGYRCEKHNQAVGGKPTSSHLKGLAVDIRARDIDERLAIHMALFAAGFRRVGVGKTFLHADRDEMKARGEWVY